MTPRKFIIKELIPIKIDDGYLIDGFPSVGFTSAIATESLIHTSKFQLAGIIDSDSFPPVSLIKDKKPNYPTRIFVNNDLNVAVFSSYLTFHESLHKSLARLMLSWAKKHKVSYIISSVAVRMPNFVATEQLTEDQSTEAKEESDLIVAAASTDLAQEKLRSAGLKVLEHGTIPGIPGSLLNQGMLNNQNVIVVLFNSFQMGPDFKSSAQLCMAMSKLVPGASCDIPSLQKEAERAEKIIRETENEAKLLKDSMYR